MLSSAVYTALTPVCNWLFMSYLDLGLVGNAYATIVETTMSTLVLVGCVVWQNHSRPPHQR